MSRILIVDDDSRIREVLRFALTQAGHTVIEASDGKLALEQLAQAPAELVVLDIMMPELDGLDVCRKLRQTSSVPILFLSSRDEELDRVLGLELGADDYLTKPFSPRELVARVKALLRRAQPAVATPLKPTLSHNELRLDPERHSCHVGAKALDLTAAEFALVAVLLKSPGRVFERAELIRLAFGEDYVITERTIDSHVRKIRAKLKDAGSDALETVYGVGYRLKE